VKAFRAFLAFMELQLRGRDRAITLHRDQQHRQGIGLQEHLQPFALVGQRPAGYVVSPLREVPGRDLRQQLGPVAQRHPEQGGHGAAG